MSETTTDNEEALKDYINNRLEVVELDFSYQFLDEGKIVKEFSITNDVKLSGFIDGYKTALMNELSKS